MRKYFFPRAPKIFRFFQKSAFLQISQKTLLLCLGGKFFALHQFTQENSRNFGHFLGDFKSAKSEIHGNLGHFQAPNPGISRSLEIKLSRFWNSDQKFQKISEFSKMAKTEKTEKNCRNSRDFLQKSFTWFSLFSKTQKFTFFTFCKNVKNELFRTVLTWVFKNGPFLKKLKKQGFALREFAFSHMWITQKIAFLLKFTQPGFSRFCPVFSVFAQNGKFRICPANYPFEIYFSKLKFLNFFSRFFTF